MKDLFLNSIEFTSDLKPIKSGFKISFNKEITVLVGNNGVGKSTILEALSDFFGFKDDTYLKRSRLKDNISVSKKGDFPVKYIDFHGHDKKYAAAFGDNMLLQLAQMKASSGQSSIALLNNAKFNDFGNGLILLDEPCRSLSIKNQYNISRLIINLSKVKNCQVVLTSHSSIVLESLKDIAQFFSVESGEDISYKDYILSQM